MSYAYPTLQELLAIHEILIEEFGGSSGLRDPGALEAAWMRPQSGYYGDIVEEAAVLMESLALNHAFVDGNKRLAFFASDTFLRMNGRFIECEAEEAYAFFMDLFRSNRFRFKALERWLRKAVHSLPGSRK